MRVGVVGINHRLANLQLREQLAAICQHRLAIGSSLHGEHHFILLSTCNRTEIYFFSENLTVTHSYILKMLRQDVKHDYSDEFDQKLYSFFGIDCLNHLCRVTTGLDSAIIVETEIQGQVKNAYENAQKQDQLPFELHYLFQKALSIAKKVRGILPTQSGLPDIEHAIYYIGKHFFSTKSLPSILFVGASSINEKIIAYFKRKNFSQVTLCNRTDVNGTVMAEKYKIPVLPWKNLYQWPSFDWVIVGTKSPHYLLHSRDVMHPLKRQLIIDLSVPRNADLSLEQYENTKVLNIDQINSYLNGRRQGITNILQQAEEMIAQSAKQHVLLFSHKEKSFVG